MQSFAAAAAFAALRLRPARADKAPGVTGAEIKIGQTFPYAGYFLLWPHRKGAGRLFQDDQRNGRCGGRKLNLISLDDGSSATKTVEQVRRMVEEERVAFIFQAFGAPNNRAVRPYLNENKAPQLFSAAGRR